MTKKTDTPAIRFKGFSDTWEQRKLGEIFKYEQPQAYIVESTEYDNKNKIPVLTAGQSFILGYTDEQFGIKQASEESPVIIFDDFTTSSHYVDFPFKVKSSAMKLLTLNNPKDNIHCAYNVLQNIGFVPVSHERHWISTFAKFEVLLPKSADEQKKIGSYFANLDQLITLHQRKYEKLHNIKKSMLEKMFPKNGSNVPEIRFKGFTEAWEQRKLSNYLEVSNEKNTNDVYGKQDVLSVSGDYGIVNQIEFQGRSFAGASVSNYGVVHTDDIVYTKSPLNANPYGIIKTNKGKTGIVSTLYAVYHPKKGTNSDFVQTYFEQHARMNNYMHPLVNKGAKNDMKVSAENALKGYVSFPNYEEQKAIAEAFSIIDCLITLHQRELEKLQNIKKSMLEKMFV